jgi:DNA-binding NtrC family response regulator
MITMPSVLIVADDHQLRPLLKLVLVRAEYEVWDTDNAVEAARIYRDHRTDVVVTDLLMPERDGLELILDLRNMDRNVRVVALSGGGAVDADCYLYIARLFGARRTLTKPFSADEFLEAVRQLLEVRT